MRPFFLTLKLIIMKTFFKNIILASCAAILYDTGHAQGNPDQAQNTAGNAQVITGHSLANCRFFLGRTYIHPVARRPHRSH